MAEQDSLLREYAAHLHANFGNALKVRIEQDESNLLVGTDLNNVASLVSCDLEFVDLVTRNKFAADYYCDIIRGQKIETHQKALIKVLTDIYLREMQQPDLVSARVFGLLSSSTDLLYAIAN
jgi:hypothetical protein